MLNCVILKYVQYKRGSLQVTLTSLYLILKLIHLMAADDPLHFSVIQKKPVSKMNRETQLWSFWTATTKRLV